MNKHSKQIEEDKERILKGIEASENDIVKIRNEAKRILEELHNLEREAIKKRKQNEIELNRYAEAKAEEIEKNQYFRLVYCSYICLFLDNGLLNMEEDASSKLGVKFKYNTYKRIYDLQLFLTMSMDVHEKELKRIEGKIKGKRGPIQFVGFERIFIPKSPRLGKGNIKDLLELVKWMKITAKCFVRGFTDDLEKKLQNLKQKVKNIKIEA